MTDTRPAPGSSIERLAAELANLSDGESARLEELRIAAGTQGDIEGPAAGAGTALDSSQDDTTADATADQAPQEFPQSDA